MSSRQERFGRGGVGSKHFSGHVMEKGVFERLGKTKGHQDTSIPKFIPGRIGTSNKTNRYLPLAYLIQMQKYFGGHAVV